MKRSAYTVLADFQAFERFKVMNSGARPTQWSRDREDELGTLLRYELGADAVAQLQAYALLPFPAQVPEDVCLDIINRALAMMGDRDVPRTFPADGLVF
jgi:hypothetical protein